MQWNLSYIGYPPNIFHHHMHSTVQYSTVQCSAVQYNTAKYSKINLLSINVALNMFHILVRISPLDTNINLILILAGEYYQ